jgi:hypothetical protein
MTCRGKVTQNGQPVQHATIELIDKDNKTLTTAVANEEGIYILEGVPAGPHKLRCKNFGGHSPDKHLQVVEGGECHADYEIKTKPVFKLAVECECKFEPASALISAKRAEIGVELEGFVRFEVLEWRLEPEIAYVRSASNPKAIELIVPSHLRLLTVEAVLREVDHPDGRPAIIVGNASLAVMRPEPQAVHATVEGELNLRGQPINVRLSRTSSDPTLDQALWVAIRNRTRAIGFEDYQDFMNRALRFEEGEFKVPAEVRQDHRGRLEPELQELGIHMHGVNAYQALKHLTEVFLLLQCGVRIQPAGHHRAPFDPELETRRLGRAFSIDDLESRLRRYLGDQKQLPYITRVVRDAFPGLLNRMEGGVLIGAPRINEPCLIELIWSYWMEEGMLVQTMNAIARRFQNIRAAGDRDPLANLDIDTLRPMNNLLWGYIQDEYNRLSVRRRAFEYDHQYGLTLYGKATAGMQTADSRSKFLEAFHNLLHQTAIFFKEDFQTTVIADGFPLLNSLREVHLILAQGAGNQFGDLAWTARTEMLLTQYMLARPEIRAFLQGRIMVPYREAWEPQVDTMKTLQGWTDVTVSYFRDLAAYGEQLLLSIRYGDWIDDNDEYSAINWARYFRPEIQGYLHAYRAATGIDLANSETVDTTIPGILLQKRTAAYRTR